MRSRRGGSRMGTFLVLTGIVGVLGATFIAGVWTGHHWPVLVGNPRSPLAAEPPAGRAAAERPRPAETLPALTFYHELTAPLAAPPPPRKPARPARPPEPRPLEQARPEAAGPAQPEVASTARPAAAPRPAELPPPGTRFTIQVAAYTARGLAEALRSTLAAAGHEARVVTTDSGASVRYRVQVGTFATREAAREAAGRLAAQRSLSTFVTTR